MRAIFTKLERILSAVAFAEADLHDTAREIMGYRTPAHRPSFSEQFNKLAVSVAFAEANCPDIALQVLTGQEVNRPKEGLSFADAVGLQGIKIWYGVVDVA